MAKKKHEEQMHQAQAAADEKLAKKENEYKELLHEKDLAYLAKCREAGRSAAEYYGWNIINCVKDGAMRSMEDIHNEIYGHVCKCLEG